MARRPAGSPRASIRRRAARASSTPPRRLAGPSAGEMQGRRHGGGVLRLELAEPGDRLRGREGLDLDAAGGKRLHDRRGRLEAARVPAAEDEAAGKLVDDVVQVLER